MGQAHEDTKEFVTAEEGAALIGVGMPTFYRLVANITVYTQPHDRRQRRYRAEDVRSLIKPPVPVGEGAGAVS